MSEVISVAAVDQEVEHVSAKKALDTPFYMIMGANPSIIGQGFKTVRFKDELNRRFGLDTAQGKTGILNEIKVGEPWLVKVAEYIQRDGQEPIYIFTLEKKISLRDFAPVARNYIDELNAQFGKVLGYQNQQYRDKETHEIKDVANCFVKERVAYAAGTKLVPHFKEGAKRATSFRDAAEYELRVSVSYEDNLVTVKQVAMSQLKLIPGHAKSVMLSQDGSILCYQLDDKSSGYDRQFSAQTWLDEIKDTMVSDARYTIKGESVNATDFAAYVADNLEPIAAKPREQRGARR